MTSIRLLRNVIRGHAGCVLSRLKALKLGNWLTTPDGQFFAEAVSMITPAPYAQDMAVFDEFWTITGL